MRDKMRPLFSGCLALALACLAPALQAQPGDPRYALVIGNADYETVGKLKNPVNDASDIAATLKRLGFDVELLKDADLPAMEGSVDRLGSRLAASKKAIGFFFYAGHGVQSSGANYLIPVDAQISSEAYLKTKALPVQAVLETLQASHNAVNIVVLDACRDNPFVWARSLSRGLSVVGSQPAGSIVTYATGVGSVAQDGEGRNGVFTSELLKNLGTPGEDILEVFQRTGAGVQSATDGAQIPAIYSQFFGKVYLAGEGASSPKVAPSTKSTGTLSLTSDPPGIEISIDDGEPVEAPTSVELAPGSHSIEPRMTLVNKVYYREQPKEWVDVAAGSAMTIPVKSEPSMGNLTIRLAPPGYSVFVNDEAVGVTPLDTLYVKAGTPIVRFDKEGEPSRSLSTTIGPDSSGSVSWGSSVETAVRLERRTIKLDGKADSWAGIEPVYGDAGNHSYFMGQAGLGMVRAYLCRDDAYLYWRIDFGEANPLSKLPKGIKKALVCQLTLKAAPSRYLNLGVRYEAAKASRLSFWGLKDEGAGSWTDLGKGRTFSFNNAKDMLVARISIEELRRYCSGPVAFSAQLANDNGGTWEPGSQGIAMGFIDF